MIHITQYFKSTLFQYSHVEACAAWGLHMFAHVVSFSVLGYWNPYPPLGEGLRCKLATHGGKPSHGMCDWDLCRSSHDSGHVSLHPCLSYSLSYSFSFSLSLSLSIYIYVGWCSSAAAQPATSIFVWVLSKMWPWDGLAPDGHTCKDNYYVVVLFARFARPDHLWATSPSHSQSSLRVQSADRPGHGCAQWAAGPRGSTNGTASWAFSLLGPWACGPSAPRGSTNGTASSAFARPRRSSASSC